VSVVLSVSVAGNKIGDEGAKALGPHLAKLSNMTHLYLTCTCLLVVGGGKCNVTRVLAVGAVDREQDWRCRCGGAGPTLGQVVRHDTLGYRGCVLVGGVLGWFLCLFDVTHVSVVGVEAGNNIGKKGADTLGRFTLAFCLVV